MKNIFGNKSRLLAFVIFGIFLVVYWKTCCTCVFWWDSAEFVAAVSTSGIPHPPGFPLYILTGRIFSFLPFYSLAYKLNLLSGLFSALSLAIFLTLFIKFIRIFFPELAGYQKLLLFSSLISILVIGLNYAFWIQGVRAEVYSLNGLIFVLLFACSLNFLSVTGMNRNGYVNQRNYCWAYLFFFIFGLGMGNHNVTLLSVLPAFILLFISYDFRNFVKLKNLIALTLLFLLGCSIYLYLPLRAANSPAMNWGNPITPASIISAASAFKSFNQIGFVSGYMLWERAKDVWLMIYSQVTLVPFLLSIVGLFFLLRRRYKLFIFFSILIVSNSFTIIILPSEIISGSSAFPGYVLPTIFSIGLFFGIGIFQILKAITDWIKQQEFSPGFKRSLILLFSIFFFLISLSPFLTFYDLTSLARNDIAYNYGKKVLSQVRENSVIFIDNNNLYFILCALKYAEGYREDVAVLDRGLLRTKWNCLQERRNYPRLFKEVPEGLMGEDLFLTMTSRGLSNNIPIYMEFTERDTDLVDFILPAGYLYKMEKRIYSNLPEKILAEQGEFERKYFALKDKESYQNDFDAQKMFVLITYRWGLYCEQKGLLKEALRNYSMALEQDPVSLELQWRMKRLQNRIQLAEN